MSAIMAILFKTKIRKIVFTGIAMRYRNHYEYWNKLDLASINERIYFYKRLFRKIGIEVLRGDVLDIGCGDGVGALTMKALGAATVTGIDADIEQTETAKTLGVHAYHVDDAMTFLSQNSVRYSTIFMLDIIEHLPVESQIPLLMSVKKSLLPEGRVVITTPNANSTFAGRYRYVDWTHFSSFTEHSLRFVLKEAGFSSIHITNADIPLKWYVYIHPRQIIKRCVRLLRRLEAIGELGRKEGAIVPLSLNLLAVAS